MWPQVQLGCRLKAGMTMAAALMLASCIPGARPGPARPSERETAQCHADLRAGGIAFRVVPDRETGPGCGLYGAVQLTDIGVPVTNLGAMRCGQARAFAAWVREDVAPAVVRETGSGLARIETFGTYACRNVVGSSGPERRSGHAIANAVDIGGLRLRDGRRITVAADWTGEAGDLLRSIRRAACRRFGTVLSPDYNAAHADHLHLEDDRAGLCR
jgi:hypothetical protein